MEYDNIKLQLLIFVTVTVTDIESYHSVCLSTTLADSVVSAESVNSFKSSFGPCITLYIPYDRRTSSSPLAPGS